MKAGAFTKGIGGVLGRGALLPIRYGLTPTRMRLELSRMRDLLERCGVTPTIPTTGVVLRRHPGIADALRGADVAIHGYRHVSYSDLTKADQASDIDAARKIFSDSGFDVRGFRAPYLRANGVTLDLLAERQLAFDSSLPRMGLQPGDSLYQRVRTLAERRYRLAASSASEISNSAGVVELPVALPDDEILIDGMGIRSSATQSKVFESMLGHALQSSSLLVLQVHPERFRFCSEAIELLVEHATDEGAWVASLSEAADWIRRQTGKAKSWPKGRSFALSVTGDLDAISLGDFARRFVGA